MSLSLLPARSRHRLMTSRFPRRTFKRTLSLLVSKSFPPNISLCKTNRIMADCESLCLSNTQVRRKRLLRIKHTLTSNFIGNQGNHRINSINSSTTATITAMALVEGAASTSPHRTMAVSKHLPSLLPSFDDFPYSFPLLQLPSLSPSVLSPRPST